MVEVRAGSLRSARENAKKYLFKDVLFQEPTNCNKGWFFFVFNMHIHILCSIHICGMIWYTVLKTGCSVSLVFAWCACIWCSCHTHIFIYTRTMRCGYLCRSIYTVKIKGKGHFSNYVCRVYSWDVVRDI